MAKRKTPKAKSGLYRFMHGLFVHYYDKGMPINTAKAKMLDETYDTIQSITKSDDGIPDHLLVMTMEHAVQTLRQRGYAISTELQQEKDPQKIETLRTALQQMKKLMDELNDFISLYRGEQDE